MAAEARAMRAVTCPNCRSRSELEAVDCGECAACGFEIDAFAQRPDAERAYRRLRGDVHAIVIAPVLDGHGRWLVAHTRLLLV